MYSHIKLWAKYAVQGSYLKFSFGILFTVFLAFCFMICNALPEHYGIGLKMLAGITALVFMLLVSAASEYCLQLRHLMLAKGNTFRRKGTELKGIFRACELKFLLLFIKLFWFVFFEAVPLISATVFIFFCRYNPVSLNASYTVIAGLFLLFFAGAFFCFLFVQRYSRAMFYLVCYREFTPLDAIRESVRKSSGRVSEIFFLKLSFLPWFLLCIGVLPAFYVVPYYKQSLTCYWLSR